MQENLWIGHILCKGMNITRLSKALREAIDSFNQGVPFEETEYRFDEASLKDYLYAACKNRDNRRKIVKKSGALSKTFVAILTSSGIKRFPVIVDAIKDDPDLKDLCDKIKKIKTGGGAVGTEKKGGVRI